MSSIERITVTLTSEIADTVRQAVKGGDYASSSEIIREALRDWKKKRLLQEHATMELRAEIKEGLADVKAGRVKDFNADRIIKKGKKRSAKSAHSA